MFYLQQVTSAFSVSILCTKADFFCAGMSMVSASAWTIQLFVVGFLIAVESAELSFAYNFLLTLPCLMCYRYTQGPPPVWSGSVTGGKNTRFILRGARRSFVSSCIGPHILFATPAPQPLNSRDIATECRWRGWPRHDGFTAISVYEEQIVP